MELIKQGLYSIGMEDSEKAKNARDFAQEKHKNQKRGDGTTSHFDHLEGVVYRLKSIGITDSNVICAAWLHDILEKTDVTLDEIIQRFGKEVAVLVLSLTKSKDIPKKDIESQYIKQLSESSIEAKIIKLCDISSNIKDISNSTLSKTQKNKKIRKILHYLKVIRKDIAGKKSEHPKIQEIIDGINSVLTKIKQPTISI